MTFFPYFEDSALLELKSLTFDFALFIHVQLKFFINNKLINIMQDHLLSVMVSCCFFDNLAIDLNLVVLPEFLRLVFSKCTLLVPNLLGL